MKRKKKPQNSATYGTALLDTVNDAVHGPIDLRDEHVSQFGPVILRLINAPFLARLRSIKQLSYTSHFVTSADHSRFAHALGTMHVMRLLMRSLKASSSFNSGLLFESLGHNYPKWISNAEGKDVESRYQKLTQHMLLAALLQDVGELPSNIATGCFCYCGAQFHEALKPFAFHSINVSNKELTGIGLVAEYLSLPEQKELRESICWPLVFSLITGQLPNGLPFPSELKCLHHLIDGEVDADRIDYVHRDALHCLGERVTPFALIHSLVSVDADGPVFSNSAAVSFFYLLRARLWSTVYFSPQNRFRLSLLLTVMRGALRVVEKATRARICLELFGTKSPEQMTIPEFLGFHDHKLSMGIKELAKDKDSLRQKLGQKASCALLLLEGSASPDYECLWTTMKAQELRAVQDVDVPNTVFFDTFSDYTAVKAFRKKTVRIQAPEYRLREYSTVFLEETGGPFLPWFDAEPCPAPILAPYSVLVYLPRVNTADIENFIDKCIHAPNSIIAKALEENPFVPFELHDTRKLPGFTGKDIFVSFCWKDILTVRRVLVALYQLRRRYFAITSPTHGIGNSTQFNSVEAARKAGAALVITSSDYCDRLAVKSSPLRAEMDVLRDRRAKEGSRLKCAVLSVCNYREIEDRFPYEYVCEDRKDFPYVGKELANANGTELHEIVRSAVGFLEDKMV